jgi:hypothetical protein
MARYGSEFRGYDRGFASGARGGSRTARYDSDPRADARAANGRLSPRRAHYDPRGYDAGWGMSNLYNTIMTGGPRGRARYGAEFHHRSRGARYGSEDFGARQGRPRSPDEGTRGVHYRGGSNRF